MPPRENVAILGSLGYWVNSLNNSQGLQRFYTLRTFKHMQGKRKLMRTKRKLMLKDAE